MFRFVNCTNEDLTERLFQIINNSKNFKTQYLNEKQVVYKNTEFY